MEERRQRERTPGGHRPWLTASLWGSFGGISENKLRGRVLTMIWYVIFLTSMPSIFVFNRRNGATFDQRSFLILIGVLIILGPATRIWYVNWEDMDRRWLKIPLHTWLHVALVAAIVEIALLEAFSNSLEFRFEYLFILGYVAYFFSLRTTLVYIGVCMLGVILPSVIVPEIVNEKAPSHNALIIGDSFLTFLIVATTIYWQQTRLRRSNQRLRNLNSLIRDLSNAFSLSEKHRVFIRNMREIFQPKAQVIWGDVLNKSADGEVILDAVPSEARIDLMQNFGERRLAKKLPWARMMKKAEVIQFSQLPASPLRSVLSQLDCAQVMSAPMRSGADRTPIGVVWLGGDGEGFGFTQEDFVYFQACVQEYAQSLTTYEVEMNTLEKEHELDRLQEVADVLQESLLPHDHYSIPSLDVGYVYHAATTRSSIGGDFYDFITHDDEQLGAVIGDTVGHGLAASKLTALIKYTLRTLVSVGYPINGVLLELSKIVSRHAEEAAGESLATLFSTLNYAHYDGEAGTLCLGNAGHHLPIIYHQDLGVLELPVGAHQPPLGSASEPERCALERVTTLQLPAESIVVMYTDGIVEARDAEGVEFGQQGVIDALTQRASLSAQKLSGEIFERVRKFSGNNLSDDATVVVLKTRTGTSDELVVTEELSLCGDDALEEADKFREAARIRYRVTGECPPLVFREHPKSINLLYHPQRGDEQIEIPVPDNK